MSATMNASAMAPAETLLEHFSYERRDPRTADWFLMSSGMTVFAISSIYLAFAVKILPAIMAERKPIKPTLLINAYNLFQVVGNVWLTYNYLINGWGTTYSYGEGM
jgi:elongation of very long chain fatty acids protein 1